MTFGVSAPRTGGVRFEGQVHFFVQPPPPRHAMLREAIIATRSGGQFSLTRARAADTILAAVLPEDARRSLHSQILSRFETLTDLLWFWTVTATAVAWLEPRLITPPTSHLD